ncbi:MAG TPA: hypothetical protein VMC02_07325 [Steroidobacteraceae bacterium]|nr:hypothetical protein [Steroidobacteraceae bacterium]
MAPLWRGIVAVALVLVLTVGAVGAVRWAKRGGTAASFAASALLLTFGMGLVVAQPQRTQERVEEETDKTDHEDGDPLQ